MENTYQLSTSSTHRQFVRATFAIIAILCAFASPLQAATLNVPATYPNISAAITAASSGDTILVAAGTYSGATNINLNFGGKNLILVSASGPGSTTIDCGGTSGTNERAFIFKTGETSAAVVNGFTILHGYESSTGGGAIAISAASSPTIENCVFENDVNGNYGGAIYATGAGSNPAISNCTFSLDSTVGLGSGGGIGMDTSASVAVTNCQFDSNTAANAAAGIYISAATAVITSCSFGSNTSSSSDGGGGSAIYGVNSQITLASDSFSNNSATNSATVQLIDSSSLLTNCTFGTNHSTGQTSGLQCQGGTVTVSNCTFTGNTFGALGMIADGFGAAVDAAITECTFSGNTSTDPGAGILLTQSNAYIMGCNIAGNQATGTTTNGYGGGMFVGTNARAMLVNCLVTGNSATTAGAGLYVATSSNTSVINSTFTGNTSSGGTAGAAAVNNATLYFYNTILYGDSAMTTAELAVLGTTSIAFVNYSDVEGGYAGTSNINANPAWVNPSSGNYYLQTSSPCIGKGQETYSPSTDYGSNFRPNPPSIGAYEVTPTAPTGPSITSFTPTAAKVGATVAVTGTNLSSVTSVTIGGVVAKSFTVNSSTSITVTVPTGATVGPISATASTGTGTSLGYFAVLGSNGVIRTVPGEYPSISAAVAAASAGDVVFVTDGLYTGVANSSIDFAGKSIILTAVQPIGSDNRSAGEAIKRCTRIQVPLWRDKLSHTERVHGAACLQRHFISWERCGNCDFNIKQSDDSELHLCSQLGRL